MSPKRLFLFLLLIVSVSLIFSLRSTLLVAGDITTSVVGYWNADEGQGTQAADNSGNGHTGLLSGAGWGSGKVGTALHFDGVNDYVNTDNYNLTGSALTIAAWIKADSFTNISTGDVRFISKATSLSSSGIYFLLGTAKSSSGTIKPRFLLRTGKTTTTLLLPVPLTTNVWFHLAAVYNGSNMILYKDGVEIGRVAKTGSLAGNSSAPVWIGGDPTGATSKPFAGSIDEVRIYNRALTASDIADLVNFAPTDNEAPTASNVSGDVNEDASVTVPFIATDPEGDALTYSVVGQPQHGSVSVNGNIATYTPAANYFGTDSFSYQARDSYNPSNTGTVSINIIAVNDSPLAEFSATPQTGTPPLTVNVNANSSSDIEEPISSYVWDFGDGTNANEVISSHQYSAIGTYTVTLTVTDNQGASDVESVSINVTAVPAADPFTIVVLPDTQVYPRYYPEIFTAQTQWIKDNKSEENIVYMIHEGDIVDQQSETVQWQRANTSLSILDGVLPYNLAVGNHDFSVNDTRSYSTFNTYFPVSRYQNLPHFGGVFQAGTLANSYYTFNASGIDFLIISLEFGPRDAVLAWADGVAESHPNHKVILVTHDYLYYDNTLHGSDLSHLYGPEYWSLTGNNGVGIWNNFVKNHQNMFMVLSGHVHLPNDGAGTLVSTGVNGNKVYQMMANYQEYAEGGQGYLRLVRIDPSQKTIAVKTYSPYLNSYMSDSQNQFEFLNVDLGEPDVTAPTIPAGLAAHSISENSATLTWSASADPETGVDYYKLYRDGELITSPSGTSHTDSGLTEGTTYSYTISAVNNTGTESEVSSPVAVTTLADQTVPSIVTLDVLNSSTLTVEFSEAVEEVSAETAGNYAINNDINVLNAAIGSDNKTVTLAVSPLASNSYVLTVNGVRDLATTPNVTVNVTSSFSYADIPTDGLVGYWNLNEISGTTASDQTTFNNNGNLLGGPLWTSGKVSNGLQFDGLDSYVRIANSASLGRAQSSVTIAYFLNHTGTSTTYAGLVCKVSGSWCEYGMDRPGNPRVLVRNSTGAKSYSLGFTVDPNVWTHIAATIEDTGSGTIIKGYKNGVLQTTTPGTLRLQNYNSYLYFGRRDTAYLAGMLDEVRIYNRVLTDAEIAQLSSQN